MEDKMMHSYFVEDVRGDKKKKNNVTML